MNPTMRVFRLRLTIQRAMVAIAAIALAWSFCVGIGHITIYRANVRGEIANREQAVVWEGTGDALKAAEWRRHADELASRNADSRAYIITALGLLTLVIVLGAIASIGLGIKAQRRRRNLVEPACVDVVVNACLALGKIVLVGFALGCTAYVAMMFFVMVTSE